MRRLVHLVPLLWLAGCMLDPEAAYDDFYEAYYGSSSTGDPSGEDASTSGAASGESDPYATSTTSTGTGGLEPVDPADPQAPQIHTFTVTPQSVVEAGAVTLELTHSANVTRVLLFDDHGGETTLLADREPSAEPFEFLVTSKADFDGEHEFHAIVIDEHDRWAEATATAAVNLLEAGSTVWVEEGQEIDPSSFCYGFDIAVDDEVRISANVNAKIGDCEHRDWRSERSDAGRVISLAWVDPFGVSVPLARSGDTSRAGDRRSRRRSSARRCGRATARQGAGW